MVKIEVWIHLNAVHAGLPLAGDDIEPSNLEFYSCFHDRLLRGVARSGFVTFRMVPKEVS